MPRFHRDDIDKFFDYGIHQGMRTIYMGSYSVDDGSESGVDAKMAEAIIKGLYLLDTQTSQGDKPITILMNNPGGDDYHGFAIFDAIKICKNHVTIKVFGYAMSMGSIILQAGDERLMSPNARMMIHYGQFGFEGHTQDYIRWGNEAKFLNERMENLYLEKIRVKNPKYSLRQLRELLKFDTFIGAEEAVKLGLADDIIKSS